MISPLLAHDGVKSARIDCPNCDEYDKFVRDRDNVPVDKCDYCGYNDCEVIQRYVFQDDKWVEVEGWDD